VHNVVSITGKDDLGLKGDPNGVITKDDGTFVHVINPSIAVEKSANKTVVHDGDAVTYSFKVTNTGDVSLTNVKVTDDVLGDIGTIATLDPGAANAQTLTKDFTVPAGSGDVVNHVNACGADPLDKQVCGTDEHHLPRIHPAISLDKKVNGADHATAGDALLVHAGNTVTYTVVAKNTSPDTPLTVTAFGDDHSSSVPSPACDKGLNAVLQPGDTIDCTYTGSISDDVHNVASITAKDAIGLAGDPKGVVTASDGTFVHVVHPAIKVEKSGPAEAHVGDTVTYSFKVTNTGDVALNNVDVSDDVVGSIGTIPSLAPGASTTLTKDYTIPPNKDPVDNTVTVCGRDAITGVNDPATCNTDHHHLDVLHPALAVDKKVNGGDHATDADALKVHASDTATYTVVATNTSPDTDMTVTDFTDDHAASVPSPACDKGIGTVLKPGDTIHCTYTATIADDVHNVVSITAKDDLGLKGDPNGVVTKSDGTFVKVINPNITVEKSADKPMAHDGDPVTYSFKVTNTGDVTLTNVIVHDDILGDIGTIASLDAGTSQTLTKDFTVPAGSGDVVNHVSACGSDPLDKQVCDTDSHNLPRIHPAITLDKKVNGGDHTTADDALDVHSGDTVTYSVVAKNTSPDTPLTVSALSDDHASSVPDPSCDKGLNAVLQPNETITCSYTATITDDVHNVASITGKDPLGLTGDPKGVVTATDGTFVHVIHPAIAVVKSGPATAHEGDKVTYTFKVTNTGDVNLTNVVVTDDKIGSIGTIASLAKGASTTLTKDFTIPAKSTAVDNTVTACGADALDKQVCGTDKHHLVVIHPSITVVKSGPADATPGQVVTYTFQVTNAGDTDLTDVKVTDDKLGDVGTIDSLKVGETTTLTKQFTVPSGVATVDNTVTACGTDALSLQVCGTDVHHMTVTAVLGENFQRPTLAVTGEDSEQRLLGGLAALLGALGLAVSRRRRGQV
jgi:uncharacterized repeat protein (TIGR01451 family)